jgi:hypothetical protein
MHQRWWSAPRQIGQCFEIASDQRVLLFASPALYSPFGGDGILYPLKLLMECQGYWPSEGCVAVQGTRFIFGDAPLEAAAGRADVIRAVDAPEQIEISAHVAFPAAARSISASKLAAMA